MSEDQSAVAVGTAPVRKLVEKGRVLVVGAKSLGLGSYICDAVNEVDHLQAFTAGINGDEDLYLDLVSSNDEELWAATGGISHIVVTAGINRPWDREGRQSLDHWMTTHYLMNVVGPMRLWEAWKARAKLGVQAAPPGHFVVISSNSARIPRSQSMAYCASKAALSMAVRVAARETGGGESNPIIYGYEPGLLRGTPMTTETENRFPGLPLTRMKGYPDGVDPWPLAQLVAHGLSTDQRALNGCLVPYDDGEL